MARKGWSKKACVDDLEQECISKNNPSYDSLYEFYNSALCLFTEGVEFMTKTQIYDAIKEDCNKVSNDTDDLQERS